MRRDEASLLGDRGVGEVAVTCDDGVSGAVDLRSQLAGDGIDNGSFPARRPHMPSMPEHCCTVATLVPINSSSSRLPRPMF